MIGTWFQESALVLYCSLATTTVSEPSVERISSLLSIHQSLIKSLGLPSKAPFLSVSLLHIQQGVSCGVYTISLKHQGGSGTKNLDNRNRCRYSGCLISTPRTLDRLGEIRFRISGRYERPWKHGIRGFKQGDLRNANSIRCLISRHDTALVISLWKGIGMDINTLWAQPDSLSI